MPARRRRADRSPDRRRRCRLEPSAGKRALPSPEGEPALFPLSYIPFRTCLRRHGSWPRRGVLLRFVGEDVPRRGAARPAASLRTPHTARPDELPEPYRRNKTMITTGIIHLPPESFDSASVLILSASIHG